jgi:hypothetical protein
MSLISRLLLASMLFLAAPAFAQFGGGGGRGGGPPERNLSASYDKYVLVENGADVPEQVRHIIAAELVRTLKKGSAQERAVGDLISLSLNSMPVVTPGFGGEPYGAHLNQTMGDNAEVKALSIRVYMPDDAYDESLLPKRWEDARQKLQTALRNAQQKINNQRQRDHVDKASGIEDRLGAAQVELARVIEEIEAAEQQGSPEQLRNHLESARNTLSELALHRVSAEARREAIVARIDELRGKSEDAAASDPLIEELEKIVAIRERQLQAVRDLREAGTIPTDAISDAETEMANARVELLKARRAAMADAAGGVVQELNNELSRLIVQLAELDARSKALHEQVENLRVATSVSATTRADQLNHKLMVLQRRVAELEEAKAQLESQAPPTTEEITITPLDEALSLSGDDEAPERE